MNMNEEYLDNLLKNMNNASAAPEANLKPAKEENAGGSLTPEEITALFDAAEKIANGEEPESLSDEPEDSPVSAPEETTPEDSPVSMPEEMTPEDSPVSAPEETTPEDSPVSAPEETTPEDSPVSAPEETTPEDSPVFMPETTGPDGGDAFGAGTGTSDNADNLTDEAPGKQSESASEMLTLPEDMEKELQEMQRLTEENEIPTEISYGEKPTAGQETEASTGEGVMEMDPADIDELLQDKSGKKEKKPGFFKRLLAFFTEEATPEEEPQKDENEEVLAELDKEDKTAEQDKKKKKEKKKKDKPAKGKGAKKNAKAGNVEDGDEEEDGKPEKGKGKGKAKKASKKKKEKPEVPEQEEKASKGYTKKNIILVCLFSAAVFAVLYLSISYVAPGYAKKNAVTAFENQDYLTCYEILYGQNLTEREQQLFNFSNMVLRMQKKISDYDKYVEDGENLYALDSLMQAVEEYEETQEEALACGADGEMLKLYREVLTILLENYGLDEEGVRGIAFCDNKVEYTRMLDTLINGGTVDIKEEPATDTEDLPDLLPEEEETDDTEFLPEDTGNTL
jgi:pilus assembly protein FimV